MLNAPTPDDYRIAIPIARKHGIEVYAWLWTMNLEPVSYTHLDVYKRQV